MKNLQRLAIFPLHFGFPLALMCAAAHAAPLDPNSFSSLGPNPFTVGGTYTVHTGTNNANLELRDPGNSLVTTGVLAGGVAVFTFDDIDVPTNVTISGAREAGSRPVALLSHGDIAMAGTVNVSGAGGASFSGPDRNTGGAGGAAGPGGGGGGGGSGGGTGPNFAAGPGGTGGVGAPNGGDGTRNPSGGNGGAVVANGQGNGCGHSNCDGGGGAFGGNGGNGINGGGGGTAYGDLTVTLQGGSGGGGGSGSTSSDDVFLAGAGGGGGGGAVELGGIGNIVIDGLVYANGGTAGSFDRAGGGGAGGGILVRGDAVVLSDSASLSASGGNSDNYYGGGGGGGGGRIHIAGNTISFPGTNLNDRINVAGGSSGSSQPGGTGVFTTAGTLCPEVLTVTTTDDSGCGSLRQAILAANALPGKDVITFAPSAYGTITLTNGELLITDDLDIFGPGATNVTVNGNAASRVFNITAHLEVSISGLTIANGHVEGIAFSVGAGAGIRSESSTLTISNCTVVGNSAGSSGGGIFNNAANPTDIASLTVRNSSIVSNSSGTFGGGIGSRSTDAGGGLAILDVANSTFSGNDAFAGGGIDSTKGSGSTATVAIANCTFRDNSAFFSEDGGVRNQGSGTVGSSIFDNSTIVNGFGGTTISQGYNLSSDDGSGILTSTGDQTNTPPLLGPLQLNGGQTPTHAFTCDSPALDNGNNFSGSATDQTGAPRTVGGATDVGAFELQQICNNAPIASCTNVTVSADAGCSNSNASIDNGSFDPDGDTITTSQSPAPPYPLGDTLVTLTVVDTHSATSMCTATVTVEDITPPVAHCPGDIIKTNDNSQCSAVVTFSISADDNCTSNPSVTADPPSGSTFTGSTNVVVTAVDFAGNTNTCSFSVTVVDGEAPKVTCRPAANPSGKKPVPGKNGNPDVNSDGYYQVLAKDNCDADPLIYIKDTGSSDVFGPFHNGDVVRLKHAGGVATAGIPGVPTLSLHGNGLAISTDAGGNTTADADGCTMVVRNK